MCFPCLNVQLLLVKMTQALKHAFIYLYFILFRKENILYFQGYQVTYAQLPDTIDLYELFDFISGFHLVFTFFFSLLHFCSTDDDYCPLTRTAFVIKNLKKNNHQQYNHCDIPFVEYFFHYCIDLNVSSFQFSFRVFKLKHKNKYLFSIVPHFFFFFFFYSKKFKKKYLMKKIFLFWMQL